MRNSTRPFLAIYVLWHPDFAEGPSIAKHLREHFDQRLTETLSGGLGLDVLYRSRAAPGADVPLGIDLEASETSAIVVLADDCLAKDAKWIAYVRALAQETDTRGLRTRLFPVIIGKAALRALSVDEQGLRWDHWRGTSTSRTRQLIAELAYEFCRMLRHYLERLRHPEDSDDELGAYLKKVQIFLSHSKHDPFGQVIAEGIRRTLFDGHGLASFFDVHDIPSGLRFNKVLLQQVRTSAVVAIHTDSYSSREWCRREIIEAKRASVPLVVANCLHDLDQRGFPYLGNVPIVRLEPNSPSAERIDALVGRLLDEVLRDFVWRCQTESIRAAGNVSLFLIPRLPELISLANLPPPTTCPNPIVVYPDPPLSAEEERLFEEVAPHVQLRSLREWQAGAVR